MAAKKTRTLNLAPIVLPGRQPDGNGASDWKPSQFWLNVGVRAEDGTLLQLPLGIPLDDLKAKPIPSVSRDGDPSFRHQRVAEAALVETLQEMLATLEPGETLPVEGLAGEIRRVKDKQEVSEEEYEENPYLSAVALFGSK